DVIIHRRVIDMNALVPMERIEIGAAVIARGRTNCNAKSGSLDEKLVEGIACLCFCWFLRPTPANRNYAGLSFDIVHSGINRIEETVALVRSKINGNGSLRRDRSGHFDIEHDFAIIVASLCLIIAGVIDGYGDNFRQGDSYLGKKDLKIVMLKAAD